MSERYAYTDTERRLTLISVMIVFLLSAVSQTIVATAMPRIIAELHGLKLYAWATTAYLLSSTVMVPIWGKLGDLYGRKIILLIGMAIFMTGSCLSGLAGELGTLPLLGGGMTQLIIFRAIQGLGGGALFTTAFAILADLFPPRERARFQGLFGSMFGIASVVGPVIGGFFTDHGTVTLFGHVVQGWRWVFYVNVPLALIALFMVLTQMPTTPHRGTGKVDVLGAGLIMVIFIPLLLVMTWGGRDHAWTSPLILSLVSLSILGAVAFVFVERTVWDPILPLELFKNRTFVTANTAALVYSMAFMGVATFLPLYMQLGQGVGATKSGLVMLALMGGMIASSTINGQFVTRTGHFKPFMIGGGAVFLLGLCLLATIGPDTSTFDLAWRLAITGIGLGPGQSLFGLAVQNAAPPHQIGVTTSSSQFVRQIGGAMGVALFGAIVTSSLAGELSKQSPAGAARHLDIGDLQGMALAQHPRNGAAQPPMTVEAAKDARILKVSFSTAVVHGIIVSVTLMVAGFACMLLIPAAPLRERDHADAETNEEKAAEAA
ncbi:MAG: MDR family MFS transporter [Phenylobacterium sp.]|uniref:MDR family MFS transporter n=1 Tax=Phenylobacterium sp. TaxID=1871053 RepID=UPI0027344079|nr:MDR family MFS transporter [Phenylobacterium sp.]MDP3174674.1 MDR family MFS transporter [Phenylobacterium sp.]